MSQPASCDPLRVVMVVNDERDQLGQHELPQPSFGAAPTALVSGFDGLPGVELHLVCCERKPVVDTPRLSPNIYFHPVRIRPWYYLRTLYLASTLALRRVFRRLQPALVHGQGTERFCGLAAAFSGRPNLVTIHGNMRAVARHLAARPFSFHWFTAKLEALTLRRTHGVICKSSYTMSQVASLARLTWTAPNALAADFFQPLTGPRQATPLLLNIGHIAPYKGQVELLETAGRLFADGLRFELEFIGGVEAETPYGRRFVAALARAAEQGWARHAGILPREQVIRRLDAAHALIHVSREESFGLAVAEALARNVRLFAFRSGGVADVVADIPGADIFPPEAWAALTEKLSSWLRAGAPEGPPTGEIMAARYAPRVVASRHLAIYRELLGLPGDPAPVDLRVP
jgi:glycosyltransferase involved in cell wall biosynthesis